MRLVLLAIMASTALLEAHSGRTDSSGGHYNRSTGEYHFHDGRYAGRQQVKSTSKKESTKGTAWVIFGLVALVVVGLIMNKGSSVQPPNATPPATSNHQVNSAAAVSDYYYLSSSGVRHNRRCRYYRKGRPCSPSAGTRCRICGG